MGEKIKDRYGNGVWNGDINDSCDNIDWGDPDGAYISQPTIDFSQAFIPFQQEPKEDKGAYRWYRGGGAEL